MAVEEQNIEVTEEELKQLRETIQRNQAEIERLENELKKMAKSKAPQEKKTVEKKPRQSSNRSNLFDEAENCQDHKAVEPTEETFTVKANARRKKNAPDEGAKELPVQETVLDLDESQLTCPKCGGTFRLSGKKFIRRELAMIPGQVKALDTYAATYVCDSCKRKNDRAFRIVVTEPLPLLKNSLASAATVANIMVQKFDHGVSLASQEKRWAKEGVVLSSTTMANWVVQCTNTWLKPLYRHMKQRLMMMDMIQSDGTPVQVLHEGGSITASGSRMWVYTGGGTYNVPIRLYEFQPGRSGKRPESFLRGFSGFLITDGKEEYRQVKGVTHIGSWAHMRDLWADLMKENTAVDVGTGAIGCQYCDRIFSLESKCANYIDKLRGEFRRNVILPVVEEYFLWVKIQKPEKGTKLAYVVDYAKDQKAALSAFLDHGDAPISALRAARAIEPFKSGNKCWLFRDSAKGAETAAIVYSLIETAKANKIDPYNYLLCVLYEMPYIGKAPSHEALDELMPWNPQIRQECSR